MRRARVLPDLIVLDLADPTEEEWLRAVPGAAPGGQDADRHHAPQRVAKRPTSCEGLNLGADDYVAKPFDLEELTGARARRSCVRAKGPAIRDQITLGNVVVDFVALTALRGSTEMHMRPSGVRIAALLVESAQATASMHRDELLQCRLGVIGDAGTRDRSTTPSPGFVRRSRTIRHHPCFIHTVAWRWLLGGPRWSVRTAGALGLSRPKTAAPEQGAKQCWLRATPI